jgi:hypothetical protein|tara:strand:- start:13 stop:243 length:231 start_codon:yes stop_codon:yes gene_type:complete
MPQIIFNVAKNFGIKRRKIGKKEPKNIETKIIETHIETNIRDTLMHCALLLSGMHSFITLVLNPKACSMISLWIDL